MKEEVKVEIKPVEDSHVKISFKDKKYVFKLIQRTSKKGKEYIGFFTKTGYKGFINLEKTSGQITLGKDSYRIRKKNNDYYFIYEGKTKYFEVRKNLLTNPNYHEDNVKAEIYKRLSDCGIKCQLEYRIPNGRVDIAILDDVRKVKGFIEVKKMVSKEHSVERSNIKLTLQNKDKYRLTKQFEKYLATGKPLFVCTGYENIPKALNFAKEVYVE